MTKKIYFLLMVWGLDALHFFHFDPMKYASIFPLWGVTYFLPSGSSCGTLGGACEAFSTFGHGRVSACPDWRIFR
ncbi:hypothetical protein J2803_000818 [Paraburkholderia phenoliruptrix]|nr:hypothetical protein [Paraburkholderia phenoliruptrix]